MPSPLDSDAGRRLLVAAGTAHFDKLAGFDLLQVAREIEQIASAFSALGYERLEGITDPDRDQLRKRFEDVGRECGKHDFLVAYYTGHGARGPDRFYVLTRNSDSGDLSRTALAAEDLARALAEGSKALQLLVILDTCYAAAGFEEIEDIASSLTFALKGAAPAVFLIAAAGKKQEAEQGVLSTALAEALANRDERLGGRTQPFLAIDEVMGTIDELLHGKLQVATWSASNVRGRCLLFPNPRHCPEIRPGLDLETQRAFVEHWVPKARGAELGAGGWYFTGREQAMRELTAWLWQSNSGGRARVVTGGPGCGKSALLARIVTLSDPTYREEVLAAPMSPDPATLPPEGVVHVAVHARRKLLANVVTQIAGGLKLSAREPSELLATLADRVDRAGIVVDALDEADDKEQITSRLLIPLAQLSQVFLLVGTRPDTSGSGRRFRALGESAVEIDLDDPRYVGANDVARYIERRLLATEEPGRNTPYRAAPDVARTVAQAVSERANNVFLVAHTAVLALLANPSLVDISQPGWIAHLPAGVGDAFAQFLSGIDERKPDDLSAQMTRAVLQPLAFAEGEGLPWADLWSVVATAISGSPIDVDDITLVRKHAAAFIVEATESDRSVYRLYHESVAEHLRGSVEARRAQRTIVKALRARVPRLTVAQERDWTRAHPYTLTHLASHALKAGWIGKLSANGTYIVAADLPRMLKVLSESTDAFARQTYFSYALAFLSLRDAPPDDRLSYLEMAARQLGNDMLAGIWTRRSRSRPWTVPWAHWNAPDPHRLLARLSWFVNVVVSEIDGVPVVITSSGKGVHIIDLRTGEVLEVCASTGPRDTGGALAATRLAERPVAAACRGDRIDMWDLRSRAVIAELAADDEKGMRAVHIHATERTIVLASGSSGKLYIWDLDHGTAPIRTIDAHSSDLRAVTAARIRDIDVVAAGSKDGTVFVWNIATAHLMWRFKAEERRGEHWVLSLVPASRGTRDVILAGYYGGDIIAWDPMTGERVGKTIESEGLVAIYGIAPCEIDERPAIVIADSGGAIRVQDLETGAGLRKPMRGHEPHTSAWSVAVVHDGGRTLAISGGSDGTVRAWDLDSAGSAGKAKREQPTYTALSVVSRHGKPAVACVTQSSPFGGTVHVLDAETGTVIEKPFPVYEFWLSQSAAVTEIRGKTVVAFGSYHGDVSAMNVKTGKSAGGQWPRCYGNTRVAFSKLNGLPVLAVADEAPAIHLFDFLKGGTLWTIKGAHGKRAIWAIGAGTHQGRPVILSSGFDGLIRLWDTQTRAPLGTIEAGGRRVTALTLAPMSRTSQLVFGDENGSVHLIDLHTGTQRVIHTGASIKSIAIAPDSGLIVATSRGLMCIRIHAL